MGRAVRRLTVALSVAVAGALWSVAPGAGAAGPPATAGGGGVCDAGAAGPAGGAVAGGVTFDVVGQGTIWCPSSVLAANLDVPADAGISYPLQGPGGPSANTVSDAVYLWHLLGLAGLDPSAVQALQVLRPDGTWVTLDSADVADPSDYEDGLYPLVALDGVTTEFLRPPHDAGDDNAADAVPATGGAALELYVFTGPLLTVEASAAPTVADPAAPVRFSASATGAPGPLRWTWQFGDGDSATGPNPVHAYDSPGLYAAVATVTGPAPDGATGATGTTGAVSAAAPAGVSEPVLVRVVGGGSSPGPGQGGSPPTTAAPTGPTSTVPTTPVTVPGGSVTGHGTGGPTGPARRARPASGVTSPTGRSHTETPPTRIRVPAAGGVGAGVGTRARQRTVRKPSRPSGGRRAGPIVAGQLLGAAPGAVTAVTPTLSAGAATQVAPGGGSDPWPGITGGVVAAGLVLAGAGREVRARRRPAGR